MNIGESGMEKLLNILKKSIEILKTYPLCDYCLGRQFASIGSGLTNLERGRAIKTMLFMNACAQLGDGSGDAEILKILAVTGFRAAAKSLESMGLETPEIKSCYICNGVLNRKRFNEIAERISEELGEYEFKNFVVGARIPPDVREREDLIRSEFEIDTGEDIKGDVTREIGRILLRKFDAAVEYHNPEIVVLVDIFSNDYLIQVNPLFIKGFYRKLVRNLPQTPWYCRYCWGKGCEYCNYTGREYPESVSEFIGNPAIEFFEALDYKFHGAGREDVDATVIGAGRPFVLELKHPRKRYLDLKELEKLINEKAEGKVEVSGLEYSSRKELRLLKSLSPMASKTYEAIVEFDGEVDEESLKEVEEKFKDIVIEQRTPRRVLKRRADKIRQKRLYYVEAEKLDERHVKFRIKTQGGLYVKELIDGDEGRTKPNIAEFLGRKPLKIDLSVIEVETPTLGYEKEGVED